MSHEAVLGLHYSMRNSWREVLNVSTAPAYVAIGFKPPLPKIGVEAVEQAVAADDEAVLHRPDEPVVVTKSLRSRPTEEYSVTYLRAGHVDDTESNVRVAMAATRIIDAVRESGVKLQSERVKTIGWDIELFEASEPVS